MTAYIPVSVCVKKTYSRRHKRIRGLKTKEKEGVVNPGRAVRAPSPSTAKVQ